MRRRRSVRRLRFASAFCIMTAGDSLQTGMRGAWGKPYGTVARVNIGQIIMSVRSKENNSAVIIEALRRARYKFPGRQKIIVSKKWGFTNVSKDEYLKLKEEKRVMPCVLNGFDGNGVADCAQRWCLCTVYSAQGLVAAESAQPATRLIDDVIIHTAMRELEVSYAREKCPLFTTMSRRWTLDRGKGAKIDMFVGLD